VTAFKANIFGPLLIAIILQRPKERNSLKNIKIFASEKKNNTLLDLSVDLYNYQANCGANNCPNTALPPSLSKPTLSSTCKLFYSMIAMIVLSALITFIFIDNNKERQNKEKLSQKQTSDTENLSISKRFLILFLLNYFILYNVIQQIITYKTNINQVKKLRDEFVSLIKTYKLLDVWLLFPITFLSGYELTIIWFEYTRVRFMNRTFMNMYMYSFRCVKYTLF
jgi:hypothetical protein